MEKLLEQLNGILRPLGHRLEITRETDTSIGLMLWRNHNERIQAFELGKGTCRLRPPDQLDLFRFINFPREFEGRRIGIETFGGRY